MSDPTPKATPPAFNPAFTPAWRSRRAIAVFLTIAVGLLAADLVIKYLAFEHVADFPIRLESPAKVFVEVNDQWYESKPLDPAIPASAIPGHDSTPLIPSILDLRLTINTGAVFGSGAGLRWLFVGVSIIAVGVIGYLFVRSPANAWLLHAALALILAGALGNLYDRVRYAAVRDMFHLFPDTRLWPWIWNLADAVLMLGVGLVLLINLRKPQPPAEPAAD
ncbi:MAG: signal peptidase II [Planctomycetota bacterium]